MLATCSLPFDSRSALEAPDEHLADAGSHRGTFCGGARSARYPHGASRSVGGGARHHQPAGGLVCSNFLCQLGTWHLIRIAKDVRPCVRHIPFGSGALPRGRLSITATTSLSVNSFSRSSLRNSRFRVLASRIHAFEICNLQSVFEICDKFQVLTLEKSPSLRERPRRCQG